MVSLNLSLSLIGPTGALSQAYPSLSRLKKPNKLRKRKMDSQL